LIDTESGPESVHQTGEIINPVEAEAAARDTPTLEGRLAPRRDRRRLDLMSLDGVAREGARVYRMFAAGRMGTKKYAAAVSGLRRQAETLRDITARDLIERDHAANANAIEAKRAVPQGLASWYSLLDLAERTGHPLDIVTNPVATDDAPRAESAP